MAEGSEMGMTTDRYGVSLGDDKNILKLDGAKKCSVRNKDKSIKERDTVV